MYFGSRPYWKDAAVGRPFGFADPEKAAPVAVTDGAAVVPGAGAEVIVAEVVADALLGLLPRRLIVTLIGYVPAVA